MPLYEYLCESCGERTEALQKIGDPPLTTCSSCGGAVKRLLSAPAFQFKGSGWYVTDYARSAGGADAAKGGTEAPAKPAAGDGAAATTTSAPAKSGEAPAAPKASPAEKG